MREKSDHELLLEIHTVLYDTNGNPGLCRKVEKQGRSINKLWIAIALIIPSSGSVGFAAALKILGG